MFSIHLDDLLKFKFNMESEAQNVTRFFISMNQFREINSFRREDLH